MVGLGLADVSAARAAAESGLKVVAIERSSDVNARSSQFAIFNSDNARAMGIEDIDTAELVNELMTQMNHRPDFRVLKTWADNCGEAYDWYVGADPDIVWLTPGTERPTDEDQNFISAMTFKPYVYGRDHEKVFSGTLSVGPHGHAPMLKANLEAAQATGNLTAVFDTRALQLTKDGGRVSGVVAQSIADGSYLKATASKAVILATGDYLGDGHRMGYWAGGHIEEGPHAAMAHGDLGRLGVDAFLQLNARGERYINEDLTNDHFGSAIVRQPEALIYQIFDANWADQLPSMQAGLGTRASANQDMIDSIDEWTTPPRATSSPSWPPTWASRTRSRPLWSARSSATTSWRPQARTRTSASPPSACSRSTPRPSTRSATRWAALRPTPPRCAASSR